MHYLILGTRQTTTAKLSYTATQHTTLPRPWFVICGSQNREKEWVAKQCLVVGKSEVRENVKVLILDNIGLDEFPTTEQLANVECLVVATALPSTLDKNLLDRFDYVWVSATHGAKKQTEYYNLFVPPNTTLNAFKNVFNGLSSDSDYFVLRPPGLVQLFGEEQKIFSTEKVDTEKLTNAHDPLVVENKLKEKSYVVCGETSKNELEVPREEGSRHSAGASILDIKIMHKVPEYDRSTAMELWVTFRVAEKLSLEGVLVNVQKFLAQDLVRPMFIYASYDLCDKTRDLHFYFQIEQAHELLFSGLLMRKMRALKAENVLERVGLIL